MTNLQSQFGAIDIYLFDQILRERIVPGMQILDAGCGAGRNLVYLLQAGYSVFGVDANSQAIAAVRRMAASLRPDLPLENFRAERIEAMSFPDEFADVVLSSAVLHFAEDDEEFNALLQGTWRGLKPGGLLFCRLASSIGMENQVQQISGRRYRLPDGSERYLVDEPLLTRLGEQLRGEMIDPLKTTIVQDQRCMTTWVIRKNR